MFHYDIRILNCVFNRVGCSVVPETEPEVICYRNNTDSDRKTEK